MVTNSHNVQDYGRYVNASNVGGGPRGATPALPLAASGRCGGILRGDPGTSIVSKAQAFRALALTSTSLFAISSILQPRCAAIMDQVKSAWLRDDPVPSLLGDEPTIQRS
jgi:hypothetical protein